MVKPEFLALLIALGFIFFRRHSRLGAEPAGELSEADLLAAMRRLGLQKLDLAEEGETASDDAEGE